MSLIPLQQLLPPFLIRFQAFSRSEAALKNLLKTKNLHQKVVLAINLKKIAWKNLRLKVKLESRDIYRYFRQWRTKALQ
jgi:hypothetical protein